MGVCRYDNLFINLYHTYHICHIYHTHHNSFKAIIHLLKSLFSQVQLGIPPLFGHHILHLFHWHSSPLRTKCSTLYHGITRPHDMGINHHTALQRVYNSDTKECDSGVYY